MDDTTRKTAIGHLTTVIHASSPFLTTFLLIHLSAPVLANVGGSSLASQVMVRASANQYLWVEDSSL